MIAFLITYCLDLSISVWSQGKAENGGVRQMCWDVTSHSRHVLKTLLLPVDNSWMCATLCPKSWSWRKGTQWSTPWLSKRDVPRCIGKLGLGCEVAQIELEKSKIVSRIILDIQDIFKIFRLKFPWHFLGNPDTVKSCDISLFKAP